ncbi:hydrogenase HycP [Kribbella karoonensis]|uniref:Hydrogenase HycP n=2 Tax=Kribbellaceae TaxID=2726069 RepID=A0ABP4NQB7_9ACTN
MIVMTQWLYLICGGLLLSTVLVLWRREFTAIVRLLVLQGVLLGALAGTLAVRLDSLELAVVAVGVLVLKAVVVPGILRRVLRDSGEARETEPLVNVTASIVAAALLTLLAYAASRPIVRLSPTAETHAVPVGLAMVLIGFFVLVTRRRALSQIVGFLVLDNGIATTAFLITGGVPGVVELAVSLDVLLVVLVLQVLTARLRAAFGGTDIDELQELHD